MEKTMDIMFDYMKKTLDLDVDLIKENLRLKKENQELRSLLKENGIKLPEEEPC